MNISSFFSTVASGDIAAIRQQLNESPCLAYLHNPDTEAWDERSPLEAVLKPPLAVARLQSPWICVAQKGPYRQDMTPFRRLAHDDFARA